MLYLACSYNEQVAGFDREQVTARNIGHVLAFRDPMLERLRDRLAQQPCTLKEIRRIAQIQEIVEKIVAFHEIDLGFRRDAQRAHKTRGAHGNRGWTFG